MTMRMLLPLVLLLWIPRGPFATAQENVTTVPTIEVPAADTGVLTASSQWEAHWLGAARYHFGPQGNETSETATSHGDATSQGDARWLGTAVYYRAGPGLCVRADGAEAKGEGMPLKNGPFPKDLCARICRVVPGCYGWTMVVFGAQGKEGTCVLFKEPTLRAGGEGAIPLGGSCWVRVVQTVKLGKSSSNELCRDVPLHLWCAENAGNKGLRLNTDNAGSSDVFVVRTERRGRWSRVCATRKDMTHGWGMQLEISCSPSDHVFSKDTVPVMVGSSGSESKCVAVTLPLWCGVNAAGTGARLNWESGDEGPFAVGVEGGRVCVGRPSGAGGWKSQLQILCNRGSQPELPAGMVPVAVGPGVVSFLPLADRVVKDVKCVDGRVLPVRGAEAGLVCARDAGDRGKRINPDFVDRQDAFDIQHSGRKVLCARRLDYKQGWHMNLHLACRLEVFTTPTSTRTSITRTRTSTTGTSTTRTKTSTTWTSTTFTWTLTTAIWTSTTDTWTSATATSTLTTATRTSSTAMQTPTTTAWSPDTSTTTFESASDEPLVTSTTEEGWEEAPLSVAPISTTMFIAATTTRGDASPRRRDTSPRRRDTSRRRFDISFRRRRRRRDTSPRRRDTSPRRRDASPRRRDASPRRRDSSTRRQTSTSRETSSTSRKTSTSSSRTTKTATQTSTTSTATGGSCPLLPRPTRLLSSARRLQNAYNTEMGQPYWVLQKVSCPGQWDMYAVRGCHREECDPQSRPPASRGQNISVSLAYFRNRYDHGVAKDYEEQAATTKRKLDELDDQGQPTHNLIPFGGPAASSPQGFQPNRQGSETTVFWIDFHICRYNDQLVILKIGTGSRKEILKTLEQEMRKGVGKSYYWCRPGSIQIYLFSGGSSKAINEKLEQCLRSKFVPASEEKDVGERNGRINPRAGQDQCRVACADESTRNFHSSMGCPEA